MAQEGDSDDESTRSVEGDGDDELVVMVEIKLATNM